MKIDNGFLDLFVKTTSEAAYASSLLKGKGDKIAADQAAVDKMRLFLNKIPMKGRIVIGEGEMDEAPMLYIGELLGTGIGEELDIAVDPLEGTNLTAKNLPNSMSVLAVANKSKLLHAPDTYMEKIAVGKNIKDGVIDLDFSIKKNLENLADFKNTTPDKLTICLLERERHANIVSEAKKLGTQIKFISDGDVAGAIYAGLDEFNVDIYVGIGGAPEGVLAASAIKCLGGQFQARLVLSNDHEIEKAKKLGITDLKRKYKINDLVGDDVLFCATGVTGGDLIQGIKVLENGFYQSETLVLHYSTNLNKKIISKFKI
jgi:fructose-1,6-bisphosphatase II / sedoheptulose-1,7-bisphosphatase